MVTVSFNSSFRPALGGADKLEMEAETLRELMRKLVGQYPRMQKHLDAGVVLAIDGQIYRDNRDVKIPDAAEVYLMPRIHGG
jgi:molybdopterin converting factor small subunit